MNATITTSTGQGYMPREVPQERRRTWRQKLSIIDKVMGKCDFYVDFGEYSDGRLAEVFLTSRKSGTFVRGVLDSLARSVSLAIQCGTSPLDMARQLRSQTYPPSGSVEAVGSTVDYCTSIADYVGREIEACYGADGRRLEQYEAPDEDLEATAVAAAGYPPEKQAGHTPEPWRTGV